MATIVSLMRDRHDARVRITTVATYIDSGRARRWLVGTSGMVRATWRVLRGRVDVLHVHLTHRGSVVRKAGPLLAARAVGVPAVIHAHSYDFAGWFDGLPAPAQCLVRAALPAQRWLTLGVGLAGEYRTRLRLDEDQVLVLANPVELPPEPEVASRPAAEAGTDAAVVGVASLGRLGERKGSYDLVSAIARVDAATRAVIRVVAAGDGEIDEVRRAASDAGVSDVFEVRSWLSPAERDAVLAGSEILVLPSYAEGLPMALLEAMAWGLVPVVTPVGGIGEVVEHGVDAIVVQPGDVDAVARALETLVADPAARRRMGRAARDRAALFALDGWFEQLIALWTAISAERRPPR